MKRILAVMLIVCMIICLCACGGESSPIITTKGEEEQTVDHPIHANTQPYYYYKEFKEYDREGELCLIATVKINSQGLPETIEHDHQTGSITKYSFSYDDNGNVIQMERTETNSDTVQLFSQQWEYDNYGNIAKVKEYSNNELIYECQYTYDERGNVLQMDSTSYNEGEPVTRGYYYTYKYDANGNIIEKEQGGNTTLFEYDERGNLIWIKKDGGNGEKHEYVYDQNDNVVRETDYHTGGVMKSSGYRYEYDEQGKRIAEVFYSEESDGRVFEGTRTEYEYDEEGRIIKWARISDGYTCFYGEISYFENPVELNEVQKTIMDDIDYLCEQYVQCNNKLN